MYHLITVATQNVGRFEELIHNAYDTNVIVLGMGQKWTGFRMKFELVFEYINSLPDDAIVIFVDGYDSTINKDPSIAVNIFKNKGYKMLISKDFDSISDLLRNQVFGFCNNIPVNSGLYMGYVYYLKQFIKESLKFKCNDDQVITTKLCNIFDYVSIDDNNDIFYNYSPFEKSYKSNAVFLSYPGSFSIHRWVRSIREYSQFFLNKLLTLFILSIIMCIYHQKTRYIPYIIVGFSSFYAYIDKSCI